jgi:hypothetical protein
LAWDAFSQRKLLASDTKLNSLLLLWISLILSRRQKEQAEGGLGHRRIFTSCSEAQLSLDLNHSLAKINSTRIEDFARQIKLRKMNLFLCLRKLVKNLIKLLTSIWRYEFSSEKPVNSVASN